MPNPAHTEASGKSAGDEAIAELERMMKIRLRSEREPRRKAAAVQQRPSGNGPNFPKEDVARQAREAIPSVEREEEEKDASHNESDDECLSVDLGDQLTPADRVFSCVQSWVYVSLRLVAGTLTVIAGCELAYAFDLLTFEGGRNGAILAAVLGCFAAARWITKE